MLPRVGRGSPRPGMAVRRRGAARLSRRFEARVGCGALRRLDRGGLLFDQLYQVFDDISILEAVVGGPADIDLMRVVAAAGAADIGLAGFPRSLDDAADPRGGQRRC